MKYHRITETQPLMDEEVVVWCKQSGYHIAKWVKGMWQAKDPAVVLNSDIIYYCVPNLPGI